MIDTALNRVRNEAVTLSLRCACCAYKITNDAAAARAGKKPRYRRHGSGRRRILSVPDPVGQFGQLVHRKNSSVDNRLNTSGYTYRYFGIGKIKRAAPKTGSGPWRSNQYDQRVINYGLTVVTTIMDRMPLVVKPMTVSLASAFRAPMEDRAMAPLGATL